MHKVEDLTENLYTVMAAQEATQIWRLSRNAVTDACRRGTLRGRKSGKTWLITIDDMLIYQRGRYYPNAIPEELKPAFNRALERWEKKHE